MYQASQRFQSKESTDQDQEIEFLKSITALGSIDENLTFDEHVNDICSKASRQISAQQRFTALLDMPIRKAIYNSFIVSNFNYFFKLLPSSLFY